MSDRRFRIAWASFTVVMLIALGTPGTSHRAQAAVVISDGFGDADRNNDGTVALYDTDINDSGTLNDPVEDLDLSDSMQAAVDSLRIVLAAQESIDTQRAVNLV